MVSTMKLSAKKRKLMWEIKLKLIRLNYCFTFARDNKQTKLGLLTN